MPYKCEKIRLSEKQDRRRKLTTEQKVEIVSLYETGLHSQRSLARQFNVSRTTIGIIVNPVRAEAVRDRTKKHWRDYATTGEEHAAIMREHRQYKYELYKKGELK